MRTLLEEASSELWVVRCSLACWPWLVLSPAARGWFSRLLTVVEFNAFAPFGVSRAIPERRCGQLLGLRSDGCVRLLLADLGGATMFGEMSGIAEACVARTGTCIIQ
jgi:hypothetical protein